ncbi:uncharacterized protein LOC135947643 [Cloeon dipterum]|uniref:uncharacterized protein LOC135947641 n=1 Tax=Cloeon dipterum TaxID=197152 RepID=UPI0032204C2D
MAQNNAQGDGAVHRIVCQLPSFWKDNPDYWFRNAESNFHIANITAPTTRYHYVVRSLDQAAVRELTDILDDDALRTNYEEFKKKVIARFSLTDEKKLRELLSTAELGDRTPSQLLRHLRSLAGANVPDKMMRTLWADKLPAAVQTCLAPHPTMALEELTVIADSVFDVVKMQRSSQVCAATSSPSDPIAELSRRLEVLETNQRSSRPQGQYRGNWRNRYDRSRSRNNRESDDYCYYHRRFKEQAYKCEKPCSYTPKAASPNSTNKSNSNGRV